MQQQSMLAVYLVAAQDCLLEGQPVLALAMATRALSEAHTPKSRSAVLRVINYLRLVVRRMEQ